MLKTIISDPQLCCDIDQAKTITTSIVNINIFQRCPTCKHNLRKHYCYMSCATNQEDFLEPNTLAYDGTINGVVHPGREL